MAECPDGPKTIAALRDYEPDLLLLDIQMPGADGFEDPGKRPTRPSASVVVFTTAYDQYALRAFEAHALDYLLKPFDQERLHRAIERARLEILKAKDSQVASRILDFLNEAKAKSPAEKRLVIKAGGRVVFLGLLEEIGVGRSGGELRKVERRQGIPTYYESGLAGFPRGSIPRNSFASTAR